MAVRTLIATALVRPHLGLIPPFVPGASAIPSQGAGALLATPLVYVLFPGPDVFPGPDLFPGENTTQILDATPLTRPKAGLGVPFTPGASAIPGQSQGVLTATPI